jgi:hypothetical protein
MKADESRNTQVRRHLGIRRPGYNTIRGGPFRLRRGILTSSRESSFAGSATRFLMEIEKKKSVVAAHHPRDRQISPLAVHENTTRHLAVSLHPAEDLRNPQEARGIFRPRSGRIGFRGEQPLSHAGAWYPEIPNTAKNDAVIPTPKAHAAISKQTLRSHLKTC